MLCLLLSLVFENTQTSDQMLNRDWLKSLHLNSLVSLGEGNINFSYTVNFPVIYTWSYLAIFLPDKNNRRRARGILVSDQPLFFRNYVHIVWSSLCHFLFLANASCNLCSTSFITSFSSKVRHLTDL